jgi:peptidoglycan/LPS O-acetylase OafA/YrhL
VIALRRIITRGTYLPQIDGLRFAAIASVYLFHLHAAVASKGIIASPIPWQSPRMLALSTRGVDLFFVISGFVLAMPFALSRLRGQPSVKLTSYFLRRLTRLEPPYILNLVLCFTVFVVTGARAMPMLFPHLVASALYVHNLVYQRISDVNGVAWSLEIEAQFYVAVPALAAVFRMRNSKRRRALLVGMIVVLGWASALAMDAVRLSILGYLNFFLAGFLACDLYLEYGTGTHSLKWDALALVMWPLVWVLDRAIGHVLLPLVIVVLYLAAFRGRVCSAIFSQRLLTNIGGMCYTIYLYHYILLTAIVKATKGLSIGSGFWPYLALQGVLITPVILAVCTAFFLLIERPCMDRKWPARVWCFLAGPWSVPVQQTD